MLYSILLVHFFALATPGPDFFFIAKTSLANNSNINCLKAIVGIVAGCLVWLVLTIVGLNQLFKTYPVMQTVLSFAGAGYLFYLAYLMVQSALKPAAATNQQEVYRQGNFFIQGLFTNLANPKAVIYFASIFSSFTALFVNYQTIVLVITLILIETAIWFSLVTKIFATPLLRKFYMLHTKKIELCSAAIFCFFAITIIISSWPR